MEFLRTAVSVFNLILSTEAASCVRAKMKTTGAPRESALTVVDRPKHKQRTKHFLSFDLYIRVRDLDGCPKIKQLACAGIPFAVSINL